MKNKLVIGNMKMNLNKDEIERYLQKIKQINNSNVVICPSSIYIPYFLKYNFEVGIQNVFYLDRGAYTGEISAMQANSLGVHYCLVGHSERRTIFSESDQLINQKIKNIISNHMVAVFCVGEKKGENLEQVLNSQLMNGLTGIENLDHIVIAYEPVWAIGTSLVPAKEEITMAIRYIKNLVKEKFHQDITVLYGGSVNVENIDDLNRIKEVDGFLVGGSSLKPEDFIKIIEVAVKE